MTENRKPYIAYVRFTFLNTKKEVTPGYKLFWAWSEQDLKYAVLNYGTKCGLLSADSISKEEYEKHIQ